MVVVIPTALIQNILVLCLILVISDCNLLCCYLTMMLWREGTKNFVMKVVEVGFVNLNFKLTLLETVRCLNLDFNNFLSFGNWNIFLEKWMNTVFIKLGHSSEKLIETYSIDSWTIFGAGEICPPPPEVWDTKW